MLPDNCKKIGIISACTQPNFYPGILWKVCVLANYLSQMITKYHSCKCLKVGNMIVFFPFQLEMKTQEWFFFSSFYSHKFCIWFLYQFKCFNGYICKNSFDTKTRGKEYVLRVKRKRKKINKCASWNLKQITSIKQGPFLGYKLNLGSKQRKVFLFSFRRPNNWFKTHTCALRPTAV